MKKAILIALALSVSALANDTLGTLKTSGLVYQKSDLISMESEELYISLLETRVKYVFKNDSDKPVTGLMVFPLPTMGPSVGDNFENTVADFKDMGHPEAGVEVFKNPLKFTVKVDGRKKDFRTEVKSDPEKFTIDVKYFWEQEFPPRKQIVIEHSYLTTAGSGYPHARSGPQENPARLYCFDDAFNAAFNILVAPARQKFRGTPVDRNTYKSEDDYVQSSLHYAARHVGYILKTGANWKGPIKNFKLTLDKGKPENLLSVCWEGFRPDGRTKFVSEKTNYTPDQDLSILIIDKSKFKLF